MNIHDTFFLPEENIDIQERKGKRNRAPSSDLIDSIAPSKLKQSKPEFQIDDQQMKDIKKLQKKGLTFSEAEVLAKEINEHYSEWMSNGEDVYIKSDKQKHSGGAIEYNSITDEVFVHIRGKVKDNKRVRESEPERGLRGIGGTGKVADSVLMRAGGSTIENASGFVQKKAKRKDISPAGEIESRTSSEQIEINEEKIKVEAEFQEQFNQCKYVVHAHPSVRGLISEEMNIGDIFNLLDKGPIPEPLLKEIIFGMLMGLVEIHDLGVVHRDIKPDNVMLNQSEDGKIIAKIGDLGFAIPEGEEESNHFTAEYLSLSRLYTIHEKGSSDSKEDNFAAGVVIYSLCADSFPPFSEAMRKVINAYKKWLDDPTESNEVDFNRQVAKYEIKYETFMQNLPSADNPRHINFVIKKLLQENPEDRPTAIEAVKLLENVKIFRKK